MVKDFTLHHRVARPISVHFHRPIARSIHLTVIAIASAFLAIKLYLYWLATRDIVRFAIGKQFTLEADLILVPFFTGVIFLILLTIYSEKFFYRELGYLQRKYKLTFEHAFKHK